LRSFQDQNLRYALQSVPGVAEVASIGGYGTQSQVTGVSDLDGQGDVVVGTVIMRFGENALSVINRVKAKLQDVKKSLPDGVEIKITYDRSQLIERAIANLRHQLIEEMLVVSLVILLFLWHFPSAFIPIITIPIAVILSFIPMLGMKLTSNIMSLAGIAISMGVLVDGAIVQMENVYKHLEFWEAGGRKGDYQEICLKALKEVGPAVFFSLLVIAVSFFPIFTLLDQEGRLFKPLAWSKTFSMAIAAILVVTLNPALRMWLLQFKTKYYSESKHPISRVLFHLYNPVCRFVLTYPKHVIAAAVALFLATIPVYLKLGSEFMPPLWEGDILYMPVTTPDISVPGAMKLLQTEDKIIKSFPEVERVWGKAGRIDSSTDPAPLSMMETTILLKPENQWPGHISHEELIDRMDAALQIPGSTNAWTMPIKNRIDMQSTGIRTPIGIKIFGRDIKTIERIGIQVEKIVKDIPGTRNVYAERTGLGPYMLRDENGLLAGYVYVDVAGRDIGSYVDEAKKAVDENLQLPEGYQLLWSGQYENMLRVRDRLKVVLPLTIFIITILLYMNTKSMVQTGIVLLSVPFSLIGAVWLLWVLGYNVSLAVWVGMIALMGLDAETGVLLLLFMELSYKEAMARNQMNTDRQLKEAIIQGAVRRLRPKLMTVAAAFVGLLPIMWSIGAGSDVMKRIAAPMVGGLITSFLLGLLVYPAIYYLWKSKFELKGKLKD
jgi:Cu/Ag efflux pump CusA